ncbi:MAG: DUF427 domain-containing protein [Candidatus Dormibacteraeota bacterium]|uniref:DUF427 domain-containing protein n=1 Tax=Candidatus Amunia macphersoniae TaxID=3127014 RepID=A0A934KN93_9BACT|nr:DUF427 domain-containing protein [Candidatus Dormibacteraeota bacterium]
MCLGHDYSMPESVWDYPRPPRCAPTAKRVQVILGDLVIADTTRAHRVLETSHPPVYYIPREDIVGGALQPSGGLGSFCEWKGAASYLDVIGGDGHRAARAAWIYAKPTPAFAAIADAVAFYPGRMGQCTVDGEDVQAQEGDFYGGWITSDIVGPFKGGRGTIGW